MWRARLLTDDLVERARRETAEIARILSNPEYLHELSEDAQWERKVSSQSPIRKILCRIPMPLPMQALHVENSGTSQRLATFGAELSDVEKRVLIVRIETMHRIYLQWCIDILLQVNPLLGERIARQVREIRERNREQERAKREGKTARMRKLSQLPCIIGVGARWDTLIVECHPLRLGVRGRK